jgi:hypothetical protein
VLLGGAVAFATTSGGQAEQPETPGGSGPVQANQQDPPLPTGLTIRRSATYDPETGVADVTITYSAQNAPLTGPFLEVLPGTGSACPDVTWPEGDQSPNLPSTTDVTAECAWAVDPVEVPEQGTAEVQAQVSLDLGGPDTGIALQEWLDGSAASTVAAVSDSQVRGTAYPAQRMQAVEVVAPPRTVSGTALSLDVYPVWPDGVDRLNPVYRSPSIGDPSSLLTAIAGGEQGIRFIDGCSGALAVQDGGLLVTALNPSPECRVLATVGNFDSVESTPFAIVTRGS